MIRVIILSMITIVTLFSSEYRLRKYDNVQKFYESITNDAIKIGLKHNIPPASILAIAGLESGYGSGYIAQITGNILSLGAMKGDKMLPPLYLPYSKKKKSILYDPHEISKCSKKNLKWKKRAPSYKDDYRPAPFAGTNKNLEYFKNNPKALKNANRACMTDFVTNWISYKSNIKVFKNARVWINKKVKQDGKSKLLSHDTNQKFISKIGGMKNSFNYRKTWPKKVNYILKHAGLVELCQNMSQKNMSFKKAWKN